MLRRDQRRGRQYVQEDSTERHKHPYASWPQAESLPDGRDEGRRERVVRVAEQHAAFPHT